MVKMFFKIKNMINKKSKYFRPVLYPIYRIIGLLYSSQIPLSSKFEDTPRFMHGLYGIFIAGGAKIGKKCTFYHHVTLGG